MLLDECRPWLPDEMRGRLAAQFAGYVPTLLRNRLNDDDRFRGLISGWDLLVT